jgi:hypothetical protein
MECYNYLIKASISSATQKALLGGFLEYHRARRGTMMLRLVV